MCFVCCEWEKTNDLLVFGSLLTMSLRGFKVMEQLFMCDISADDRDSCEELSDKSDPKVKNNNNNNDNNFGDNRVMSERHSRQSASAGAPAKRSSSCDELCDYRHNRQHIRQYIEGADTKYQRSYHCYQVWGHWVVLSHHLFCVFHMIFVSEIQTILS